MKYFKNTELARIYHISEKSVRNWIEAAQAGKLDLQLFEKNGKNYIANTSKNTLLIEKQVEKGKKFRNTRGYKIVKPSAQFYETYSSKQIADIITNLEIHREIPYQYNFFGKGAEYWDHYTQRLLADNVPSTLTRTIELLNLSEPYLERLLRGYTHVNVVDIGIGNALPSRPLLEYLTNAGLMHRYIGIDDSSEMLTIAERNIKEWFGGKLKFEGYLRDISYERFDDIIITDSFGDENTKTVNLALLFGGTIRNLREPAQALRTINDSLGPNDLLLSDDKLDSESSRRYFDFSSDPKTKEPVFRGKLILDLLNIDSSRYTVEHLFDNEAMSRMGRVRLNIALSIEFMRDGKKRMVDLNKDDTILLWRAWHQSIMENVQFFSRNRFELLHAARSLDQEFVLSIFKVRVER